MRTDKNYNFNKGLITEVSPLAYPENSCLDISNYTLFRTGLIARRLGIQAETSYELQPSAPIPYATLNTSAVSTNEWTNVAQQATLNFLVVQIGSTLYFHNMENQGAISPNVLPFTVNLATFAKNLGVNTAIDQITFVSENGFGFVASAAINPFYIVYDPIANAITTTQMNLMVRDLEGLDDGLANDNNPTTLSPEHNYNLLNQSWLSDQIQLYYNDSTTNHTYPSNAQVTYEAKTLLGVFAPAEFLNITTGTTQVGRGKFLVNPFNINYSAVSGIPGLPPLVTANRPTGMTAYSGRIWMGVNNKVYFSQVMINDVTKSENFYQEQDPTAEIFNQLLSSDGGVVSIPGAANITALLATETGVIVGATNGIWVISPVSGAGFSAASFRVSFVTTTGVWSNNNMCQVEDTIWVVGDGGIYVLGTSDRGNIEMINITQDTIQTYYLSINSVARQQSTIAYDPSAKKVYMFYDADANASGSASQNKYQYSDILVFDTSLKSWYTNVLTPPENAIAFISDSFLLNTPVVVGNDIPITVNGSGVTVNGDEVIILDTVPLPQEIGIGYVLIAGTPADGFQYTIGQFTNDGFFDFQYFDGVGGDYLSYLITGWEDDTVRQKAEFYRQRYQIDTMHTKGVPYLWVYSQRTEENIIADSDGNPTYDFPSSTFVQAVWEWTNQYGVFMRNMPRQVYRFKLFVGIEVGQPFKYPYDVIETKNMLRGHGKCLSLLFSSETGKDSRLWGWGMEFHISNIRA